MKNSTARRFAYGVSILAAVALVPAAWLVSPACTIEEGAIDNMEETGWQDRGRDPGDYVVDESWDANSGGYIWNYNLAYTDVILSPDGEHLLAMVPLPGPNLGFDKPGMALVVQRLPSGVQMVFPDLTDLERINFSPDGRTAWLIRSGGLSIVEMDLFNFSYVREIPLASPFSVVDVSPDGKYLLLSNLPTSDLQELYYGGQNAGCDAPAMFNMPVGASLCEFGVVNVETGEVRTHELSYRLRDADYAEVHKEFLLTYSTWTGNIPEAYVEFFDPAANKFVAKVEFPNCADELVIEPDGQQALLSPTHCARDPISVIDLVNREFVENLPGFGSVAVSADGSVAVGFTRREDMVSQWNYQDQDQPIGLIIVDLKTLDWKVLEYGQKIPAYTISPDGKRLYVYTDDYKWVQDADGTWHQENLSTALVEYSLSTLASKQIAQDNIRMERFVWTADGKEMYVLYSGNLYRLDASSSKLSPVPISVAPELMNIRPQQDYLVLGESDAPVFHLFELGTGSVSSTLKLSLQAEPR